MLIGEHAFDVESSRKKGKLNTYKTHEAEPDEKWVPHHFCA
jgi:hypothetical protein